MRRVSADDIDVMVHVLLVVLRDFPAWAIKEACRRIVMNEAGLDGEWPPNDIQVHAVVANVVKPYREALNKVTALLEAPIEPPEPPRLSRAEIEAKLGRPLLSMPPEAKAIADPPEPYDGKHMQRVEAELVARRARRLQEQSDAAP